MPRYAILIHDSPRGLHYDFFLEAGERLKTWALRHPPEPDAEIECDALADHRLLYLDYEGLISGGRGTVKQWDRGVYFIEIWSDEQIIVQVSGEKLTGRLDLLRMPGHMERWRLTFRSAKGVEPARGLE